jgi:hypothetical protein
MKEVQDSPFFASGTVSYPNGDNVPDITKTAIISSSGVSQTLTYNAAGQILSASVPTHV